MPKQKLLVCFLFSPTPVAVSPTRSAWTVRVNATCSSLSGLPPSALRSTVWHTNLPQYLSDNIEVIQKRALKCIFPGLGYAEILRRVNLDTLKLRRDSICQKYFEKIKVGTHRLNYLLPDKRHIQYNIRQQNVYPLPVTRTNRFRNSFIPWALYNCQ